MKKIKKNDKLIDHKISEFNINFMKRSIGKTGTIDNQVFLEAKENSSTKEHRNTSFHS